MKTPSTPSYASAKSAKAAAKRAGVATPVLTTLPEGRVQWAAPAPRAVAKQVAPAAKRATTVVIDRAKQNGVKRPNAGGACAAVWEWLDKNGNCALDAIRQAAEGQGWNVNNAQIELYQWRRFNGLTGRFVAAAA